MKIKMTETAIGAEDPLGKNQKRWLEGQEYDVTSEFAETMIILEKAVLFEDEPKKRGRGRPRKVKEEQNITVDQLETKVECIDTTTVNED